MLDAPRVKHAIISIKGTLQRPLICNIHPKICFLSKISAVECVLVHVKHYKIITCWHSRRMATKKEVAHSQKLMASKRAKTEEDLALEDYQRQLELAIENH
jgi:hypothetical protein